MDLTPENENFFKLAFIVCDTIPKYLRGYFIRKWNKKNHRTPWKRDGASGKMLYDLIPVGKRKRDKIYCQKIEVGDEREWDMTILGKVLLDYELQLIDDANDENNISVLRNQRNGSFAHLPEASCSSTFFTDSVAKIKCSAESLFGYDVKVDIEKIERESVEHKMVKEVRGLLSNEFQRCFDKLEDLTTNFQGLTDRVDDIYDQNVAQTSTLYAIKEQVDNLQPTTTRRKYTDEDIRELKNRYENQYKSQPIHVVVHDAITQREIDIAKFYVNLKIIEDKQHNKRSINETWNYLENQKIIDDDRNIELKDLIKDERVTFIRGIAGTGKSVVASLLAYKWATSDLYHNFNLCIIFECRRLNSFMDSDDKNTIDDQRKKTFEDFLKDQFKFDLEDESNILFVVDGLDELADISDSIKNSIINDLFSKESRFVSSKVIVTGRPHVEHLLHSIQVGGVRTLEIQGLSDTQIKKYIEKFPDADDRAVQSIKRARSSSKQNLPILHVPQFLNTFCCVAILRDGEGIFSQTDLYCWVLFLLLRQHDANMSKRFKCDDKLPTEYLQTLLKVSEMCYKLLKEKTILIEKEKVHSLIAGNEDVIRVFGSLFVNFSDGKGRMCQFTHLSIMEFISAIHICNQNDPISTIRTNLKKKRFQVVSFVCGIIGGSSTKGIISDMFDKIPSLPATSHQSFLDGVIEELDECSLNPETKFAMAMEIIVCFLHNVTNQISLKPIIQRFVHTCIGIDSNARVSNDLLRICHYLHTIRKLTEKELQEVFRNFEFRWFFVKSMHNIEYIKHLQHVFGINFQYIRVGCAKVQKAVNDAVAKCNKVFFQECVFKKSANIESMKRTKPGYLKLLEVKNCIFKENSFRYICNIAMSSEIFIISCQKLQDDWEQDLIDAIENEYDKGDCHLKEIHVYKCNVTIPEDFEKKIVEFGILLKIDSRVSYPRSCCECCGEVHVIDDHETTTKFQVDKDRRVLQCRHLNYSLEVPANSVDEVVQLSIKSTNISPAFQSLCSSGELMLSDIVHIERAGIRFKKPVLLTLSHSVVKLPEHSSIITRYYDVKTKKWANLDTDAASPSLLQSAAHISETSSFFACMSPNEISCSPPVSDDVVNVDNLSILHNVRTADEVPESADVFEHVFAGPCYLVSIRTYCKEDSSKRSILCIGCCKEHKKLQSDRSMIKYGYKLILVSQAKLYSNVILGIALSGRNKFVKQPVSLRFDCNNLNFTEELKVTVVDQSRIDSILTVSKCDGTKLSESSAFFPDNPWPSDMTPIEKTDDGFGHGREVGPEPPSRCIML